MMISLIVATLNRTNELDTLLSSLSEQSYRDFEVIIIDQNDEPVLLQIVQKWQNAMNIIHKRINIKGVSNARNIGLAISTGEIICFPDDDCMYYPDTLKVVHDVFSFDASANILLGRIIDSFGNNILKNWGNEKKDISTFKLYKNVSMITVFTRRSKVLFDVSIGPGNYYGSCEDVDYIYRLTKFFKSKPIYLPEISTWHPHEDILSLNLNKIDSYGRGFGAYIKKNLSLPNITLFCLVLSYHFFFFFTSSLRFDRESAIKRWHYIQSRIEGFLRFQKN